MAEYTFKLPDIGEGIATAEIVAWHVKVGDRVEEDAPLVDMMTDKATVEMECPVSGTVVRLAGVAGDAVSIGAALAVIAVDGEAAAASEPPSEETIAAETPGVEEILPDTGRETAEGGGGGRQPFPASTSGTAPSARMTTLAPAATTPGPASKAEGSKTAPILASPAVRARARDLGVDLAAVAHDGAHVRHADLDAFLRYNAAQGYHAPGGTRADEAIPVIGLRRKIAENMAAAKRAIPHFTYVEEIEVTALEALRAQLNGGGQGRAKLTLLPFLITAICRALPDFPMLNARYDDEAGVVTRHGAVHIGIATQTPAGLMVPVLRDAQAMNIWQLAAGIARLAEAARTGTARREELSGSTITITSLGPLGGIATAPVINRPEVAIIGPNRIIERPVFEDGGAKYGNSVRRAKLMNLSIACDHRVVDGWDAASFVQAIKRLIEAPGLLLA